MVVDTIKSLPELVRTSEIVKSKCKMDLASVNDQGNPCVVTRYLEMLDDVFYVLQLLIKLA